MELDKHKIDILCALSETKKKGKGNTDYQNYILFYSGAEKDQRAKAGVGILVHRKFKDNIVDARYLNSHIMYVTLKLGIEVLYMISVYCPDINKPKAERSCFFEELQEVLDSLPKKSKVFIIGDLNSRIGNTIIPGVMQRFNEDVLNDNGEMLITTCAENELRINNTFFQPKQSQKFTFDNTRNQNSSIDFIISNREVHPSQIFDIRTLTSANTEGKLIAEPVEDEENVDKVWDEIRTSIIESAKEAIGVRRVNLNGRKQTKPWFTNDIKILAKQKKKAFLRYINAKTREAYDEYKLVRNRVNGSIKDLKKEYWEHFSSEMENDLYGGQKKIWKVLRKCKRDINGDIQVNNIRPEQWKEFIAGLSKKE
ncbi:craniofacial development protein 2-like [Harmonia axyridis]|uniref:craniofacial development protein 2-like n=1 Tax=Harmonia axyridis TaxID=115357 RepID=UPI001E2797A8|nr:craniofacial development protein 2-like [Harmonia axyridis]